MELYKHQIQALKTTTDQNRCAYYLDMGLGKTYVGAEKSVSFKEPVILVVCQKSKIQDWIDHFKVNYLWIDDVIDLTKKNQMQLFINMVKRTKGCALCPPKYKCVAVINYELTWRRKDLLKLRNFTLMLDESSLIQNQKAKQTKFILKLQPANVILLSGTPTSGKYENLWTQAHLLGWDISEKLYQRQYVNWKTQKIGYRDPKIIRVVDKEKPYKNVDRLKSKFRQHGAVFMKTEDVLTLPKQTFIEVKVPKSKDYTHFMKNSIVELAGDITLVGDTSLTKRLYARQLCGQYSKAKLDAFQDLIQSTNDRLIVFYNFNCELKLLNQIALDCERPTSWINGQEKDLYWYEHYYNSITFVQYQAGAMGLNLQKANKVIYFSLPERSELFEQSKKRIHRIGQEQPCFYYVMMCSGTIEEEIYKALKMRKDYTDELFREADLKGNGDGSGKEF